MNALDKIISNKRLPVLFIGSGISKRYLYRFPNWDELLKDSFSKVNNDSFYFEGHKNQLKVEGLSDFEINKKLGTIIEKDFNKAYFDRKIHFGKNKNPSWVSKGISPYKMYLCYKLKKLKIKMGFPELDEEIENFKKLKNKISAIITTNYDDFIENYIFNKDLTVFSRQEELFSNESFNISELYKIHGSVSDAESIIITESDYDKFQKSRKLFIAKMLILFTESPIIFLGYSLTDENIKRIIIDFLDCLTTDQISNISDNFIIVNYKKDENQLIETKQTIITAKSREIPITQIETDNFNQIYKTLDKLTPGMSPSNIRHTRRLVKNIVKKSIESDENQNIIIGIDDIPENFDNHNLAIAIGYRESIINSYGMRAISNDQIVEDWLLDKSKFDVRLLCSTRFADIQKNFLLPVYKYIDKINYNFDNNPKLKDYISSHNSVDKIVYSRNILKQLRHAPTFNSQEEFYNYLDESKDLGKSIRGLLKSLKNFNEDDLLLICKYIHDNKEKYEKYSNIWPLIKRIIMYIDFKKYAPKNEKSQ